MKCVGGTVSAGGPSRPPWRCVADGRCTVADPRLAVGAPVGGPCLLALLAQHDGGTTAAAFLAVAAVDPEALFLVHSRGGAAVAGVGHDPIALAVGDVGLHVALRELDEALHLGVRDGLHGAPGVHSSRERHLALVDISEPCEHALIEQGDAYLSIGMLAGVRFETDDSGGGCEVGGEDVGAEFRDLGGTLE